MEKMEDASFEQYIEKNKELLTKKYKNLKEEDFVIIKARNPENSKQIIESYFLKYQYERFKKDSKEIGMPIEELAFIALMSTLETSEIVPEEEKRKIRSFIDRQMIIIKNNTNKMLIRTLENITIRQFKDKISEVHQISMKELNNMEYKWREEFKKEKSDYKDVDMYIKIKLVSLL